MTDKEDSKDEEKGIDTRDDKNATSEAKAEHDDKVAQMSETLEAATDDAKKMVSDVSNAKSIGAAMDTIAKSPEQLQAAAGQIQGQIQNLQNMTPEQQQQMLQQQLAANGMGGAAALMGQGQNAMNMMQSGKLDGDGIANMAAQAAQAMPDNNPFKGMLQQFGQQEGNFADNLTKEKLKELPGTIYNEETGEVSLFGLVEVPREAAAIMSMAYSSAALFLGDFVGKKTYNFTESALKPTGMAATNRHMASMAAAYSAIFGLTNWVDINAAMQTEKSYQKNMYNLARKVAPILDDIKGPERKHGYLSIMGVRKNDNEVIYNARKKIHYDLNTQRGQNFINLFQRFPVFVYNALKLNHRAGTLGAEAFSREKIEEITAKTGDTLSAAKAQQEKIMQRAKELHRTSEGFLSKEKSYEQAQEELMGLVKEAGKVADGPEYLPSDGAMNVIVPITAGLVGMFGGSYVGKRAKESQPVTALDMILYLKDQIEDDPQLDRYKLPAGMKADRKDNKTDVTLENYIAMVFQEHEQDCDKTQKISKRLHERLYNVAEKIATALRAGDIDTLQLIHLVGNRHIVREHGKSIASDAVVDHQLEHLAKRAREKATVDESRYFEEAAFTKEQLKSTLDALEGEERDVVMSFVPKNVLHSIGFSKSQVQEIREKTQAHYEQYLQTAVEGLAELGEEKLKSMGMVSAEIDVLMDAAEKAKEQGEEAMKKLESKPGNTNGIERQILNATVGHVMHQGKLSDILSLEVRG